MARSSVRSRTSWDKTKAPFGVLRVEQLESRLLLSANPFLQPAKLGAASSGAAVTLGAVADAYVSGSTPWMNYGNTTDLLVQNNTNPRISNDSETYLKFDLTGITGSVGKAILNLTPLWLGRAASSMTIGIQLLNDPWDGWVEGSGGVNYSRSGPITWMNSPYGSGQIVTIAGWQLTASTPIAVDVTQLVNESFNANHVVSIVVGAISWPGAGQSVDFASRENAIANYRPALTVTTSGPVNPPPTITQQPQANQTSTTATTATLSVAGADSVNGATSLAYTWSVASPAGAAAPTFSSNGGNSSNSTTVTFHQAGTYTFTAKVTDTIDGLSVTSNSIPVTVTQSLAGIAISPLSFTLATGAQQQLTVQGTDQFSQAMTVNGTVNWSTAVGVGGSFSSSAGTTVTYVAPGAAATGTIYAKDGSLTAAANVTVTTANSLGLQDPTLAALTQSLDSDKSISRSDMITILRKVETLGGGVVSSTDFSDLKTILKDAATLSIPGYVQVLAGDIINGNAANASYLGQTLGNLAVGSTATQLEKLVDKWFYGTDLPATGGYAYDASTAGSLFGAGPSHNQEDQGELGDCYLISSLGTIADNSPAAIQNMFVDNGDGTWTVRFYYNGTADYVTVNSQLPVTSQGNLIFDGYGINSQSGSNVLWIELAEKAYAQWNQTGKEGRNGQNTYAAIEGGWMADVDAQVLGRVAASYSMTSSAQTTLINAVTGHKAVTMGTDTSVSSGTGLYGNHAYAVIGYNTANGTFTLYNPWGIDQPNALTWSQLQQNCDGFVVADASGTVPFGSSVSTKLIAQRIDLTVALMDRTVASASSSNLFDGADRPAASQQPARLTASIVDALLADHGASQWSETATHRLGTPWLGADFVVHRSDDLSPTSLTALAVDQVAESIAVLQSPKVVLTAE